ncbi:hypothetical protein ACYSNV_07995 [Myroides sp. LJL119]
MQNFVMGLFVMIATYYWLKQWLTTIAPIPLLKAPGAFFILASFVFSLACLFPSTFIAPAFLCYKRVNLACHLGQIDAIVCGTLISFGVWKLK